MRSGSGRDLLKVLASVGILMVVLLRVGPGEVATALGRVDAILVAVALAVAVLDVVVRSGSWRLLLDARGLRLAFREVFYSFSVGGFLGQVVPSSLGVDVMRALTLSRRRPVPFAETLSSVVVLNLMGLAALTAMVAIGAAWMSYSGVGPPGLPLLVGASVTYLVALLLAIRSRSRFARLRRILRRSPPGRKLDGFLRALLAYRSAGSRLVPVFLLAFLSQGLAVLLAFLVYRAGGVELGLQYFAAFVPIVILLRTLPVTLAGFGAEQGFAVLLFHSVGVPVATAFAMSMLVSALTLLVNAVWGVLYILVTLGRVGGLTGVPAEGPSASPGDRD